MEKGDGSATTIISRSFKVCSGLSAPQLRKGSRPCSISGVCAKIILYLIITKLLTISNYLLVYFVVSFNNSNKFVYS